MAKRQLTQERRQRTYLGHLPKYDMDDHKDDQICPLIKYERAVSQSDEMFTSHLMITRLIIMLLPVLISDLIP